MHLVDYVVKQKIIATETVRGEVYVASDLKALQRVVDAWNREGL